MSKKKNAPTCPRYNVSNIKLKKPVKKGDLLKIHYKDGVVTITDENDNPFELESQDMFRYYEGKNKPEVPVAKATNLDFVTDEVGSWVLNFDYLFAIDTNSYLEKIGDFYISVTAVYFGKADRRDRDGWVINAAPFLTIDWYNPMRKGKMEPDGWIQTIKILQSKIPANKTVGIVIDSELGNLEMFNNRTLSMRGDWYLPENYTFMYASSDKTDEWCNKMLGACDKAAKKRMAQVVADPMYQIAQKGLPIIGCLSFENYQLLECD